MTDARLRQIEREWKATGTPASLDALDQETRRTTGRPHPEAEDQKLKLWTKVLLMVGDKRMQEVVGSLRVSLHKPVLSLQWGAYLGFCLGRLQRKAAHGGHDTVSVEMTNTDAQGVDGCATLQG